MAMASQDDTASVALQKVSEWTLGEKMAFLHGYQMAHTDNPDFVAGLVVGIGACATVYCIYKWKSFLLGTLTGALLFS